MPRRLCIFRNLVLDILFSPQQRCFRLNNIVFVSTTLFSPQHACCFRLNNIVFASTTLFSPQHACCFRLNMHVVFQDVFGNVLINSWKIGRVMIMIIIIIVIIIIIIIISVYLINRCNIIKITCQTFFWVCDLAWVADDLLLNHQAASHFIYIC